MSVGICVCARTQRAVCLSVDLSRSEPLYPVKTPPFTSDSHIRFLQANGGCFLVLPPWQETGGHVFVQHYDTCAMAV